MIDGCASAPAKSAAAPAAPAVDLSTMSSAKFTADASHVKAQGRTLYQKNVLWGNHALTGAEFTVDACGVEVQVMADSTGLGDANSQARIAVWCNGKQVVDDMLNAMVKTYTVFASKTPVQADIKVMKVSESENSSYGISQITVYGDNANYGVKPAPENKTLIEFVGDSITNGYGIDGKLGDTFKTATEDASKSYAYKTAQLLNADYSIVAMSGWGIISGYSGDGKKNTAGVLPPYYGTLGYSFGGVLPIGGKPQDKAWDFKTAREPNIGVVNLGTNDASYTKGDPAKIAEYTSAYVDFLKTLRADNPDAKIVCTLGIMGQDLYPAIQQAVSDYTKATGDSKVTTFEFDVQDQAKDGVVVDYHPTAATVSKAAAKLADYLKTLM
jgi:lysophospholipase L1-like esterase